MNWFGERETVVLFQMAEAGQPSDDEVRKVMNLTGVNETTARMAMNESAGDMTMAINQLLDDLDVDMSREVVSQVML